MIKIELSQKSIGSIAIMPKTVYWIGRPENFKEKERVDVLQKDIWINDISLSDSIEEKNIEWSNHVLLVNLDRLNDRILSKEPVAPGTLLKLVEKIDSFKPLHTIVHTTQLNDDYKQIFKRPGYSYAEKSLYDTTIATRFITQSIQQIYQLVRKTQRSFLRIELAPDSQIPVQISSASSPHPRTITGKIVDISMGGFGIIPDTENVKKVFSLKEMIDLKFPISGFMIRVNKGIIARINEAENEVGVFFDINNNRMIREDHALHMTEMLFLWTREIIRTREQQ